MPGATLSLAGATLSLDEESSPQVGTTCFIILRISSVSAAVDPSLPSPLTSPALNKTSLRKEAEGKQCPRGGQLPP